MAMLQTVVQKTKKQILVEVEVRSSLSDNDQKSSEDDETDSDDGEES